MYEDRDAILSEVFKRMADGESLTAIANDENMPCRTTLNMWLIEENKTNEYARAKEVRADLMFEQILDTAKDDTLAVDERRLRVDTMKWAAGKLHGKYSDKVKHVGGDEGDNPIAFTGFDIKFID